eukprot:3331573-Rhodomonas_salina.5
MCGGQVATCLDLKAVVVTDVNHIVDRLVKLLRYISTGQQKYLDQARAGPGSSSDKADVWRALDDPGGEGRGELPSLREHHDEEIGGGKDGAEQGDEEVESDAQRIEGQDQSKESEAGVVPGDASGGLRAAEAERSELIEVDEDRAALASRGGLQSRGALRSSRAESFRSSRSLRSGGSTRSDRSDASTSVLRAADGSHLTLYQACF